jgi:hypothetical protein
MKFLLDSLKSFRSFENPSGSPLQEVIVPAVSYLHVTLKVVPKAASDFENCSKSRL